MWCLPQWLGAQIQHKVVIVLQDAFEQNTPYGGALGQHVKCWFNVALPQNQSSNTSYLGIHFQNSWHVLFVFPTKKTLGNCDVGSARSPLQTCYDIRLCLIRKSVRCPLINMPMSFVLNGGARSQTPIKCDVSPSLPHTINNHGGITPSSAKSYMGTRTGVSTKGKHGARTKLCTPFLQVELP